jgi:DNA end-binding protein Ku
MKSGHFHPDQFQDHYENVLKDLIRRKQNGERIEPERLAQPTNVINLGDALRQSLGTEGGGRKRAGSGNLNRAISGVSA